MRKILILAATLMLSSCGPYVPSPQETASDHAYCSSITKAPSDAYANCMASRDQLRISYSEERRQKLKNGLAAMGAYSAAIQAQQQAYRPPTMTQTRCSKVGMYVNCTTY